VLRTIASADPKPAEYFVNLSWLLLQNHRFAGAEQVAREGLAGFPNDTDLLGNLSLALSCADRYDEALPVAERCLAVSGDVHSLEQVALIEMSLGDQKRYNDWPSAVRHYGNALSLLTEGKKRNPRYLVIRFNLTRVLIHLGYEASCTAELDEIAKIGLTDAWPELWAGRRAQCLQSSGSFYDCWQFCNAWLQKFPKSISLQRTRAEVLTELCVGKLIEGTQGVEPSCLDFFQTIIQDTRNRTAKDFVYLARITNWASDNPALAYTLLDEAETLDRGMWEIPFYRAQFRHHSGDSESALYHARQACAKAPWHPECWDLVARIHGALGVPDEAACSRQRAANVSEVRKRLAAEAVQVAEDANFAD
jgi:tetratricopeptide (TPR) repeat protein